MYVVAGASGQVGGFTARMLLARGAQVRVLVRGESTARAWAERGADVMTGDLGDATFLASALRGVDGFFTLLPVDLGSDDLVGDQRRLSHSIGRAVAEGAVPHVVLLSSHGAEHAEGTGPVACMHHLEEVLRTAAGAVTIVRSGYRQENIAPVVGLARAQGIVPSFLPAQLSLRMIAARDLGRVVADALSAPSGHTEVVDVQGPWYSTAEVAARLGAAVGRELAVVEVPTSGWVGAFRQAGMSPTVAAAFAEMYSALAAGRFAPRGDRLVEGTTPIDVVIQDLVLAA